MDPITAWVNMVTALTSMITEIVKGQTPEQKAQIWAWFVADQARLRAFFKIPDVKP